MRLERRAASHKDVHVGDVYTNCTTHKRDSFLTSAGNYSMGRKSDYRLRSVYSVYAPPLRSLTAEEFNDRR